MGRGRGEIPLHVSMGSIEPANSRYAPLSGSTLALGPTIPPISFSPTFEEQPRMTSLDAFEPPVFAIRRHGTKTSEPGPLAARTLPSPTAFMVAMGDD